MGRKKLLPNATVRNGLDRPALRLDAEQRESLCKLLTSYKVSLDPASVAWIELESILQQFDISRALLNRHPKVREVRRARSEIAGKARELVKTLENAAELHGEVEPVSVGALADELAELWRFTLKPQGERGHYEWDMGDIRALLEALALAAEADTGPAIHATAQDFGFARLDRELRQWWTKHTGKRASARKDSDKNTGQHSPFVEFFWQLLTMLPEDTRPRSARHEAFAQAIARARDSKRDK